MKKLELHKMGLTTITDLEMNEVNGGNWSVWFRRITLVGIGKEIIDHWDEVKRGLKNGWNFDKK